MGYWEQQREQEFRLKVFAGGFLALLTVGLLAYCFYSKTEVGTVLSRAWIREVDEEHYNPYVYTTCESDADGQELSRTRRACRHTWTTTSGSGKDRRTHHHVRYDDTVTWKRWEWRVFQVHSLSGKDLEDIRFPVVEAKDRVRPGQARYHNMLRIQLSDQTYITWDARDFTLYERSPVGVRVEVHKDLFDRPYEVLVLKVEG